MTSSRGLLVAVLFLLLGCSELRGRHHAREGNKLYLEGDYAGAVREYDVAEPLVPTLAAVALNKGLACRQLMVPGAKTAGNDRSVDCALAAFKRMSEIAPNDPRGDQLYEQTLFDADRFETLAQRYKHQLDGQPNNLAAINGLVQAYSRWDHWEEALKWAKRRADVSSHDAEAQYSVGVFIWNRLFQKGGNGEKGTYNPRAEPKQPPPPFGEGDIVGDQRVQLADEGIRYLQRALAIRPSYRDAMNYLNLLYRQKSFAFFDRPDDWKAANDAADQWRQQAMKADASPVKADAHPAGAGH